MTSSSNKATFNAVGHVDVAVIIVTYNSADHLDNLIESIRRETTDLSIRVIVADNSSRDGSLERARAHRDVSAVSTGGNLGYSAGINVAMEHIGEAESILVLNPDLRVERGAIAALVRRLRSDDSIGVVVPLILDGDANRADSIFNEPSVLRSFSDAVLGPLWKSRPAAFSEWIRSPRAYESAHPVDWATGAAMLIANDTAAHVGEWDERFFLYSEETDYCRRVRDHGQQVWFDPRAVVCHTQGASGRSQKLDILLNVNRLRYLAKHAPHSMGLYRISAILAALLRAPRSPVHRELLRYLCDESLWSTLPEAQWDGEPKAFHSPIASVVIPAHNESNVIGRTLSSLARLAQNDVLDVIVSCNGCTDDTAAQVVKYPGVRLSELPTPSKVDALNAGDRVARCWPRIYLDADIRLPAAAVPTLLRALNQPGILAGRPPFRYDATGASPLIRSYYRARGRARSLSAALWGAGVYALTESGHQRMGEFPPLTADDLYVDRLFAPEEKAFPLTPPAVVQTPRTIKGLMGILTRSRRGASTQGVDTGSATLHALARTIRGPLSLWDATVFVVLTLAARTKVKWSYKAPLSVEWERDESSRTTNLA